MASLQRHAAESKNAVMIASTTGTITYINPAFENLTGFCSAEVCGQNAAIFNAGALDQRLFDYDDLWSAWCEGQESMEFPQCFVNQKKNGEFFFMEQIIRPFVAPDGVISHYVLTGRDISERVLAIRHLAQQANHDDLTGLSNRNLFLDRLSQAFSQASRRNDRFALLYVDLDGLKKVNDRHGHTAGDELLRCTAMRLRQSVREVDTVARLGGDEFALILPDAKKRDDVEKVVNKIFQAFQAPVVWQNEQLPIRASIGASLYPENADNCEQLIQRADKAMYEQKIAGGNGFSFFEHAIGANRGAPNLL
ncbi:MAG TPA: sensor domain-containing diguanylate cyclase [Azonexus sp.]|nr:sensor domain-containing diguanylate cyclase [Azonexus sp.]